MNDLAEDAEMIRYAADTTADKRILLKHAPTTRGGGGDKGHGGGGEIRDMERERIKKGIREIYNIQSRWRGSF